jgi:hypothetical protein
MKASISQLSSVAVIAFAVLAATASAARAQSSVSAGYQVGTLSQGGTRTIFPVGFYVDGAAQMAPMVTIVGEVGGLYHPLHQKNVTDIQYTFLGGLRLSAGMAGPAPYVQVLVGGAKDGVSGGTVAGSSQTAFSAQFGGGVNVPVHEVKVRLGVDYRRVFFSDAKGGGENDIRFALGLVFPLHR